MRYADSVTRSFLGYSSPGWRDSYATQKPNKFADYQDPTYIGFYVRFPQLGVQGEGERPVDDLSINKSLDTLGGGLFFHESHPDSAIRYLKSIGEYTRAQMIKELIQGLYQLQQMPWYIQKVSGLEEIWKIDPANSFRGKDKKITFETLESIDLKMTYLVDLYRKAAFDAVHMRWMLPSNLRSFKMELVLTEIRSMQRPSTTLPATNSANLTSDISNFENPIKPPPFGNINIPGLTEQGIQNAISAVVPNSQWASGLSSALISTLQRDPGAYSEYPTIMQDFNSLATFVRFKFEKCKFDISTDAPPFFGALTKSPETMATNKMTIMTPVIREYNSYGLLGAILEDTFDQTWRDQAAVEQTFYDPGNAPKSIIQVENDFLEAVKGGETFDQTIRLKNQAKLKEANARLGGLLGGLLDTAVDIGTGALNNAIQGAISRAVLGNVFSGVFPPPIAQDIADKVILTSAPLITNLITDVVLESSGSTLDGGIQPENSGLSGADPKNPNISDVELTAPVINAPSSTTVELSAPTINPVSSTSIELTGPSQGSAQGTTVELSGPPVGPPLASKVIFVEPSKSEPTSEKVKFEGLTPMEINPGAVDLKEPSMTTGSATKVILESAESAPSNPGSVELEGTTSETAGNEKVQLTAPRIGGDIENTVQLEAPSINQGGGSVELEAPSTNISTTSNISFEDNGSTTEGTVGKIDFVEPTIQGGGVTKVELQEASISEKGTSKVELQAPPVVPGDSERVSFEAPSKNEGNLQPVDLVEPSKTNGAPTKVNFEEAKQNDGDLQKVEQEGPRVPEIELGTIDFEEPQADRGTPGSVIFKEPSINDEDLGRVSQDAPRIPVIELDSIELTSPDTRLEGELGVVPQVSPPENNVSPTIRTNLEGPSTPLDINNIGNADLQAP